MNMPNKGTFDAKLEERAARQASRDNRIAHFYRRGLHLMELVIATVTFLVLIAALCIQVFRMVTVEGYIGDISTYLDHILTIVVGLEFVRMLVDTTPANVLEVLTLAITRHVILSHDDPLGNIACIACIAGLFAIRRFLIPRRELREEMVDME